MRFRCLIGVSTLLLGACNGGAGGFIDSLDPGMIDATAPPTAFSAAAMFFLGLSPTGDSADGTPESCPSVTRDATTTTIVGGCIDPMGNEWFGTATLPTAAVGGGIAVGTITYEGFGSDRVTRCTARPGERVETRADGQVVLDAGGDGALEFSIDVLYTAEGVVDDCTVGPVQAGIVYSGRNLTEGTRNTWSGSGSVGTDADGRFEAATVDEVIDSAVCASEPASGTTTVNGGTDEAVITYDGAVDCDGAGTATWTLNGADQGEITGVHCSASPARHTSYGALGVLLLALGLLWRRRR